MRTIYQILLPALLVLLISELSAQEFYNSVKPITTESNTLNYKLTGRRYHFTSTIRGPVYLDDEWRLGSVILANGDRHQNIYLKLNTLNDDLLWYNDRTGAITILDKFIIDEFILDTNNQNPTFFRKLNYDRYPKGEHYFNVVYDGKVKLLKWFLTEEISVPAYYDQSGYLKGTEYQMRKILFIVFPDNSLIKIDGSKKSFLDLFPEQKKKVRQLFRKNKIILGKKRDSEMIRAVKLIEENFFPD
jgi:hypothetical protein